MTRTLKYVDGALVSDTTRKSTPIEERRRDVLKFLIGRKISTADDWKTFCIRFHCGRKFNKRFVERGIY